MGDIDLAAVSATLDHMAMSRGARVIVNDLLAEVERLSDINGKLALTIRACPEGHHDANLAHARAERDQLRAEVERLKSEAGGA